LRQILAAILLVAGVGGFCAPSYAAAPVDTQQLTDWFCSSFEGSLDFPKLAKTFPFDRLGELSTTRKPVQGVGKDGESTSTSVEQTAKGEKFTIAYDYQYNNDNVSSPFGFTIQVRPRLVDFNQDPDMFAKSWLATQGKQEYQALGPVVGMGEKNPAIGYTAYFSYWPGTGTMVMGWMNADDTSKFSAACKKKKQ
jgi:hypothetical protein